MISWLKQQYAEYVIIPLIRYYFKQIAKLEHSIENVKRFGYTSSKFSELQLKPTTKSLGIGILIQSQKKYVNKINQASKQYDKLIK